MLLERIIYFWSSNGQLMETVALRVDDLLMKHVDESTMIQLFLVSREKKKKNYRQVNGRVSQNEPKSRSLFERVIELKIIG